MRCSLLPTCNNPETDVATPTDGVDPNVAWRLWKRQARMNKKLKDGQDADNKGPERFSCVFHGMMLVATLQRQRSEEIEVPHKCRARCDVCKHNNSRGCMFSTGGPQPLIQTPRHLLSSSCRHPRRQCTKKQSLAIKKNPPTNRDLLKPCAKV